MLEANPEMFEMVQESLNKIIIEGRGVEGILDPALVKPKGKQKKSRTKAAWRFVPAPLQSVGCAMN